METAAPRDIIFDDLANPKLTRLQKLALGGAKKGVTEFTHCLLYTSPSPRD